MKQELLLTQGWEALYCSQGLSCIALCPPCKVCQTASLQDQGKRGMCKAKRGGKLHHTHPCGVGGSDGFIGFMGVIGYREAKGLGAGSKATHGDRWLPLRCHSGRETGGKQAESKTLAAAQKHRKFLIRSQTVCPRIMHSISQPREAFREGVGGLLLLQFPCWWEILRVEVHIHIPGSCPGWKTLLCTSGHHLPRLPGKQLGPCGSQTLSFDVVQKVSLLHPIQFISSTRFQRRRDRERWRPGQSPQMKILELQGQHPCL